MTAHTKSSLPAMLYKHLSTHSYRWCITGVAGFIGSHLLETLLQHNQFVTGIDNFFSGKPDNLNDVKNRVSINQWNNFNLIQGDIRQLLDCQNAVANADFVLHQAALSSVPLSIKQPDSTAAINIQGTLNMLHTASKHNVKRFVYASSSAVYGEQQNACKIEEEIGQPLSPYAVSKLINEQDAQVFLKQHGLATIGLRYFNIFGPRQNATGNYVAVIPNWITDIKHHKQIIIFGDGNNSRDFCYVEDVVQANLLAALTENPLADNHVFNVGSGEQKTLRELFNLLQKNFPDELPVNAANQAAFAPSRPGDIDCCYADLNRSKLLLGYQPDQQFQSNLQKTIAWYLKDSA